MKKNTGITLVALVITIIILLILAGVAMSMITGGEGLFAKANDAATKYNQAAKNEADIINQLLNGNYFGSGDEGEDNPPLLEMPKIDVGKVATEPSTIDGKKGAYNNPVIPVGFKAINAGEATWKSQDGWNKGLVIQDAVEGSSTIGSEFVWVPVQLEISEVIQTKLNNNEDLTVEEIQSTWPRKAWESGEAYTKSTRGTLSDSYTEPYSKGAGYNGENEDFINMGTSVLKNGGFYVGRYEGGTETARTAKTDPTSTLLSKAHVYPYNFVSWGKLMSDTSEEYEGSKGAVELCREMYTGKNEYSVKSSLIYGVQYDSIMEWIENEKNVSNSTELGNYYDRVYTIEAGSSYAYYDVANRKLYDWQTATEDIEKTSGSSYLLKTGEYAETRTGETENLNGVIKNIFDLAGNCWEWSMEANNADVRIGRGGSCDNNGYNVPISHRYGEGPDNAYCNWRNKSSAVFITRVIFNYFIVTK